MTNIIVMAAVVILYHCLWMLGRKDAGGVHACGQSPLAISRLLSSAITFLYPYIIGRLGEKFMHSFFALVQLL